MPSPKPVVEDKANPYCQCSRDVHSDGPTTHGVLEAACFRRVAAPKNLVCRPCALGNHEGVICKKWKPVDRSMWKYQRACADCGFPPELHPMPPELKG